VSAHPPHRKGRRSPRMLRGGHFSGTLKAPGKRRRERDHEPRISQSLDDRLRAGRFLLRSGCPQRAAKRRLRCGL
jgi:hypothetical protein